MLDRMARSATLLMTFSDATSESERILVAIILIGVVIAATFLHRRRETPTEIARESMTIVTLVLLLFVFVIVAAVMLFVWALAPGLGG